MGRLAVHQPRVEALFQFRTVFRSCLLSINFRHCRKTEVALWKKARPLAE